MITLISQIEQSLGAFFSQAFKSSNKAIPVESALVCVFLTLCKICHNMHVFLFSNALSLLGILFFSFLFLSFCYICIISYIIHITLTRASGTIGPAADVQMTIVRERKKRKLLLYRPIRSSRYLII